MERTIIYQEHQWLHPGFIPASAEAFLDRYLSSPDDLLGTDDLARKMICWEQMIY